MSVICRTNSQAWGLYRYFEAHPNTSGYLPVSFALIGYSTRRVTAEEVRVA